MCCDGGWNSKRPKLLEGASQQYMYVGRRQGHHLRVSSLQGKLVRVVGTAWQRFLMDDVLTRGREETKNTRGGIGLYFSADWSLVCTLPQVFSPQLSLLAQENEHRIAIVCVSSEHSEAATNEFAGEVTRWARAAVMLNARTASTRVARGTMSST